VILAVSSAQATLGLVRRDPAFDTEVALDALWTVWARTTWP
jgi:hypothetical protein